eukprot:8191413-Lingulodinium_polyedra.AAC.1
MEARVVDHAPGPVQVVQGLAVAEQHAADHVPDLALVVWDLAAEGRHVVDQVLELLRVDQCRAVEERYAKDQGQHVDDHAPELVLAIRAQAVVARDLELVPVVQSQAAEGPEEDYAPGLVQVLRDLAEKGQRELDHDLELVLDVQQLV